jgi:hypothetical protein
MSIVTPAVVAAVGSDTFSCCSLQLDVAAACVHICNTHEITPATKAHFLLLLLASCFFLRLRGLGLGLGLRGPVALIGLVVGLGLRSPSQIGPWFGLTWASKPKPSRDLGWTSTSKSNPDRTLDFGPKTRTLVKFAAAESGFCFGLGLRALPCALYILYQTWASRGGGRGHDGRYLSQPIRAPKRPSSLVECARRAAMALGDDSRFFALLGSAPQELNTVRPEAKLTC